MITATWIHHSSHSRPMSLGLPPVSSAFKPPMPVNNTYHHSADYPISVTSAAHIIDSHASLYHFPASEFILLWDYFAFSTVFIQHISLFLLNQQVYHSPFGYYFIFIVFIYLFIFFNFFFIVAGVFFHFLFHSPHTVILALLFAAVKKFC